MYASRPTACGPQGGRPVLCLDIDGTLLHAAPPGHGGPYFMPPDCVIFSGETGPVGRRKDVRFRPGLVPFLQAIASKCDIVIWTAAPADYARQCIAAVDDHGQSIAPDACSPGWFSDIIILLLSEHDCEVEWKGRGVSVKPLVKVSQRIDAPLHTIFVVDDEWETYKRNFNHALPVPTFSGRGSDGVLDDLGVFILAMVASAYPETSGGGARGEVVLPRPPLDVSGWLYSNTSMKPLTAPHMDSDDREDDDFC